MTTSVSQTLPGWPIAWLPERQEAQPTVTVAIPAYNEAAHIERVVRGFLEAGYPGLLEVLVADGGSEDGTRERVLAIAAEDPRVRLIDNPDRTQSAGLNRLVAVARGAVFLRADAHCDYASDYVERCVDALLSSGALNAGGAQRFVAETPFQAGVALASRSPLGSGGARYRDPAYDGYADTVFLGCFWRRPLLALGCGSPFDTGQVTNQDAELNMQLRRVSPRAIYVSSAVRVHYYPRRSPRALWIQYHRYGRGRYLSGLKHPGGSPLRSRAPFLALSAAGLALAADQLLWAGALQTLPLLLVGLLVPWIEALRVTHRHRQDFPAGFWRGEPARVPIGPVRWAACALALTIMPLAHFTGFARQLFRHRMLGVRGW